MVECVLYMLVKPRLVGLYHPDPCGLFLCNKLNVRDNHDAVLLTVTTVRKNATTHLRIFRTSIKA